MVDMDQKTRTDLLRLQTQNFCTAFVESKLPGQILDSFFSSHPRILEHGPSWASTRLPFLGVTFVGRGDSSAHAQNAAACTCDDYFRLLSETLLFRPAADSFPPPEQFVVDASAKSKARTGTFPGAVSVVAEGRFESIKTGKAWHETFIYRLSDFDEQGKIGTWEIWADPLNAWFAVGGEDLPRST